MAFLDLLPLFAGFFCDIKRLLLCLSPTPRIVQPFAELQYRLICIKKLREIGLEGECSCEN
jgi:hypothetical protein